MVHSRARNCHEPFRTRDVGERPFRSRLAAAPYGLSGYLDQNFWVCQPGDLHKGRAGKVAFEKFLPRFPDALVVFHSSHIDGDVDNVSHAAIGIFQAVFYFLEDDLGLLIRATFAQDRLKVSGT